MVPWEKGTILNKKPSKREKNFNSDNWNAIHSWSIHQFGPMWYLNLTSVVTKRPWEREGKYKEDYKSKREPNYSLTCILKANNIFHHSEEQIFNGCFHNLPYILQTGSKLSSKSKRIPGQDKSCGKMAQVINISHMLPDWFEWETEHPKAQNCEHYLLQSAARTSRHEIISYRPNSS